MTETKKKGAKKKAQSVPDERPAWMIGNPFYDGLEGYPLGQYFKEFRGDAPKSPQFEEMERLHRAKATPEEFPEEWAHMERIKEITRAQFKGSTSWKHYDARGNYYPKEREKGDYWDNWDYSIVTYYEHYYNRPDEWTVNYYLSEISEISKINDLAESLINEVTALIHEKHPELLDLARAQIEAYIKRDRAVGMDASLFWTDTLEDMTEELEIIGLARGYAEWMTIQRVGETRDLETYINQCIEEIRDEASKEADALFYWETGHPELIPDDMADYIKELEAEREGLRTEGKETEAPTDHTETKARKEAKREPPKNTKTTLEMAKIHPFQKPKNDLVPHDYFSLKVGTPAIVQAYLEDFTKLEGRFIYRKEQKDAHGKIIKSPIKNKITITNLEGELTSEDMALTSAIASLQKERNPEGYRNKDLEAPLYVSENELLKYYYNLEGKEPSPEQKAWLSKWIERKATHRVEIDFRETLREYPELEPILSRNFPDGQTHAGIIGDYDLPSRYEYSKNARKTKRTNEDGTITEDQEYTKWYYFPRYPITIYYSLVLNQSSLLDSSFRETPTLREGGKDENGKIALSPRVINRLDEMKKEGLNLWKIKDGTRYISLNKSPDFPKMKWVILSRIEALTSDPQSRIRRAGAFNLDLDEMALQIWGECSLSADRDHRRYMMTYLIYLMNNPKSLIYDIKPIKKGKKKAQSVRIELKPLEIPKENKG